jgi:hypothetical protein
LAKFWHFLAAACAEGAARGRSRLFHLGSLGAETHRALKK